MEYISSLHLKEYRQGRFTGATVRDQDILRHITGRVYFTTAEYDEVLRLVSPYGYDVMTYYGQYE